MDLSTGFSVSPLPRGHTEAMDLVKRPEWYRRHAVTRSADGSSPLRARLRADGSRPDGGLVLPLRPKMEEAGLQDAAMDCRTAAPQGRGLFHESVHGRLWQAGFYPTETAAAVDSSSGTDSDSGSDVIFLLSASKDSAACSSVSEGSVSLAEGAELALDGEGRGCFLLPSALSSASGESSCSSDSSDSVIPERHARPVVLLSDVTVRYGHYSESPINISSDEDSIALEEAAGGGEPMLRDSEDSGSDKGSVSGEATAGSERGDLRRSPRIRMAAIPVATAAEFTCRVSQHNLRSQVKCGYEEVEDTEEVMDYINGVASSSSSSSEEEQEDQTEAPPRPKLQQKTRTPRCSSDDSSDNSSDKSSDNSTDSDDCRNVRQLSESARSRTRRSERACLKSPPQTPQDAKQVVRTTRSRPSPQSAAPRPEPRPTPPAARKAAPRNTVAGKRRRPRKRRRPSSPPPLFAPGEPDLLLKYTQPREGRRRSQTDHYQPFIHVGKRSCTVVNQQEEEGGGPGAPPGPVPGTSCYWLGRLGPRSRGRPPGACCLCGRSANALGLGDLHGPYYPVAPLPQGGVPPRRSSPRLDTVGLERSTPTTDNAEYTPRVKTERSEIHVCGGLCPATEGDRVHGEEEEGGGGGDDEDDRSSVMAADSPRVPTEATRWPKEWWVHEDCGVWSTGVFLVRGRLYGLKEAARGTRDVVCCECHESGAIMGCFQKGCSLNYHYRCAISSGCLLNEENFSMKCSQHKNKVLTRAAQPGLRR
ncbi:unnamed protein product [Gadus morhua 'NCC']